MVPFQTIPPSEPFGWKDFFDSLQDKIQFLFQKMNKKCEIRDMIPEKAGIFRCEAHRFMIK